MTKIYITAKFLTAGILEKDLDYVTTEHKLVTLNEIRSWPLKVGVDFFFDRDKAISKCLSIISKEEEKIKQRYDDLMDYKNRIEKE
jgi:hypothetical protein